MATRTTATIDFDSSSDALSFIDVSRSDLSNEVGNTSANDLRKLVMIPSNNGKNDKVYMGGYSYLFERSYNGTSYWRCDRYSITRCRARLHTLDSSRKVKRTTGEHSHPPDHAEMIKQGISHEIKSIAVQHTTLSRRSIVTNTITAGRWDTESASSTLPSLRSLADKVSRQRRKFQVGGSYKNTEDLVVSPEQTMLGTELFLIYDSGPSETRTMVLASGACARMLQTSRHLFIDGTFDAAPVGFKQLVSVHGEGDSIHLLIIVNILILF